MNILTLSRFVCEMTLQEYDYIHERASKLAAGCFLLALYMKKLGHWVNICSGARGRDSEAQGQLRRQEEGVH